MVEQSDLPAVSVRGAGSAFALYTLEGDKLIVWIVQAATDNGEVKDGRAAT